MCPSHVIRVYDDVESGCASAVSDFASGAGARVFIADYDLTSACMVISSRQPLRTSCLRQTSSLVCRSPWLAYKSDVYLLPNAARREVGLHLPALGAALTADDEFVSRFTGNKFNDVWRGLKHLETHGCVGDHLWMLWTGRRRER